jgi:hypothetical protein
VEEVRSKVFMDIDLAEYSKERDKIAKFLNGRGYEVDQRLLMYYGRVRQIYYSEKISTVEVFLNRLAMNHTIEFKKGLEKDDIPDNRDSIWRHPRADSSGTCYKVEGGLPCNNASGFR